MTEPEMRNVGFPWSDQLVGWFTDLGAAVQPAGRSALLLVGSTSPSVTCYLPRSEWPTSDPMYGMFVQVGRTFASCGGTVAAMHVVMQQVGPRGGG